MGEEPSLTDAAVPVRPAARPAVLPAGWPVYLLFGVFPLWWVLGLAGLIWIVAAVPMLVWLVSRRHLWAPRGFGLWIGFLVWMLASAIQLEGTTRWIAFSYRAAIYLSMTVLFLYIYNMPREWMPSRRVAIALGLLWVAVIAFGFLAIAIPRGGVTTPMSKVIPGQLMANPFVNDLFNPKLAQVQDFVGYPVPRPAAPFTYTNEWGGTVGLLTPLAIACLALVRSYLTRNLLRLALVASLVPVVISMDRGLWIALGFGLVYVAVRAALRGKARSLLAILGFLAVVVALVAFTPMRQYYEDRLANPHSNNRRESVTELAIQGWRDSPLFGYGGPKESADAPNLPQLGTHGQVYLVLFSHGLPGLVFFMGWWLWTLWVSARGALGLPLWAHAALLIGVIEFFYYDMLPAQLCVMMAVAAVAWREVTNHRPVASNPEATESAPLLRSSS
jgi:hypothetical protein